MGIDYQYDHCRPTEIGDKVIPVREKKVVNYSGLVLGFGQRFYLSRNATLKWGLQNIFFSSNTIDASCDEKGSDQISNQNNIRMKLGLSYFI